MRITRPPVIVTLTFDPEEMARRGRLGARRRIELCDNPRQLTEAARTAFLARFASEEDRRDYFAALGRKSAAARRARAELADAGMNGGTR